MHPAQTRRCRDTTQRMPRYREIKGPTPHSVAVIARPPRKFPPDKLILDRREREWQINTAQDYLGEVRSCDVKTLWEKRNERKIESNIVKQRMQMALQANEFTIEDRRVKLRDLLSFEEALFTQEMVDKEETILERQAKMRERAKQLKENREAERLGVVHKKYEEQWRSQCEELRSILSKRMQDQITFERFEQVREKEHQEQQRRVDDAMYAQLWYEDIRTKAAREEEEEKKKIRANQEMVEVLQKQMAAVEAHRLMEEALVQEEAQLLKEQAELRKLEDEHARQGKLQKQQETRAMYDKSIKVKNAKLAREMQEELAFDMKILQKLLEETRNEALEEAQRKVELREEDQKYRTYLQRLKADEEQREKEIDKLCDVEVEKMWQRKIAQWRVERQARKKLLEQVMDGRRRQVEDKLRRNQEKREQALRDKDELMQAIAINMQAERDERERRYLENKRYEGDLIGQMDYNHRRDSAKKIEEDRMYESQKAAEDEYFCKLKDALADPDEGKMHPIRKYERKRSARAQSNPGIFG